VEKKSPDKRILRLLIVDDSPDDTDLLAKNLRIARFMLKTDRVTDAAGLQHALDKGKWDLVVTEDKLKNFTGRLALETVKRLNPTLPVIVYANEIDDASMVAIMHAGARDVVIKSRNARIIPAIERELDVAAARKEYRNMMDMAKEMEDKHKAMVAGAKDAMCYIHDGVHLDANQLYLNLFGYSTLQDLEAIPVLELIDKEDHERFKTLLRKAANNKPFDGSTEFTCKKNDGTAVYIDISVANVSHKGENCQQLTVKDITKRKAAENRLKYLSQRDPLTGLYNRHHFTKLLSDVIEKLKTDKIPTALIYIDLYDLKDINAELGYTTGDRILLKITKMFRESLAEKATIARVGGDEFAILLEDSTLKDAKKTADILKQQLQKTLLIDKGQKHSCNCATSITLIDDASLNAQDIMARAVAECGDETPEPKAATPAPNQKPVVNQQAATDKPKPAQPAQASKVTTPQQPRPAPQAKPSTPAPKPAAEMPKPAAARPQPAVAQASPWKQRIQQALKENRFKLVYQPIINLHGDADEFFEVLVRMIGDNGHLIPPGEFFAEAERSGLMKDIDFWVTEHAVEALGSLHSDGRKATFFINLSLATCKDKNFMAWVKESLESARVHGSHLVFELEESDIASGNEDTNKELMEKLTSLGSVISIDNCGLTLDTILNLPRQCVGYMKINRAQVSVAAGNVDKRDSLTAMLAMATKLEVKSVAKGIEDAHSLTDLWTFGFQYVQGNYFQHADSEISYDFTPEDETELSSDAMPSSWSR